MSRKVLLEISVETAERATAAEKGGADRIELCSSLAVGGLTPARRLMEAVRAAARVPVFAMIRPRAGNFIYSAEEFATMIASIKLANRLQLDGIVLGILTPERRVDMDRTRELVQAAGGLEVTFHRAIDQAADLLEAAETIAKTGVTRILTSGGKPSAVEGAETILAMVERGRGRIGIVAGAGITARNAPEIVRRTGVAELHSGLSSTISYSAGTKEFEAAVSELSKAVNAVDRPS
jgi:copper homeostasis protein